MELIKITEKEGKRLVSARELYLGLGYDPSSYSKWSKSNIVESPYLLIGEDWDIVPNSDIDNQWVANPSKAPKDYALTVYAAKKLAMLAKTDRGDQVREYFIECEKVAMISATPSYQIDDPIARAEKWIEEQKEKQALALSNAQMLPKAQYFDKLVDRKLNLNFRDTAKELEIGQKTFIAWLLVNSFVYRDSKKQLRPYAQHTPSLFEIKEYTSDSHSGCQTLITPRGRETFSLLLKK